jgi:hypothetical protein
MKTYSGTRGIAPLIPNLTTRWWWVVNVTPGRFIHGETAPGGWASEPVWAFWRRQKSVASAWNRKLDLPTHRLDTVLVTMSGILVVKQAVRKQKKRRFSKYWPRFLYSASFRRPCSHSCHSSLYFLSRLVRLSVTHACIWQTLRQYTNKSRSINRIPLIKGTV